MAADLLWPELQILRLRLAVNRPNFAQDDRINYFANLRGGTLGNRYRCHFVIVESWNGEVEHIVFKPVGHGRCGLEKFHRLDAHGRRQSHGYLLRA